MWKLTNLIDDTVWIVIIKGTNIIESVWSTEKLAVAAIQYHAHIAHLPVGHYDYVPRLMNTTLRLEK